MNPSSRDKRALIIPAVVIALCLIVWMIPEQAGALVVVDGLNSREAAEQRLEQVRQPACQVPARRGVFERPRGGLETLEGGRIEEETAQQAEAKLLRILHRLANSQEPPVEFRAVELGPIRLLRQSENYREALVLFTFYCAIEQLVNLLADLPALGEAVVAEELRITTGNQKDKTLSVRLTVAGLLLRSLVSGRKGLGSL